MPRVAMNESICATSTSKPLMRPINAPQAMTITIASGHGTP